MPHKRAKQSVRVEDRKKIGFNNAPSSSAIDDTPKSASRILNALSSQAKFHDRGGRSAEDKGEYLPKKRKRADGAESSSSTPKAATKLSAKGKEKAEPQTAIPAILPHEKLRDYNRRIESLLRPGVNSAIKAATSINTEQARAAKASKEARKATAVAGSSTAAGGTEGEDGKGVKRKRSGRGGGEEGDYLEPENRPVKTFAPVPAPRRLNDVAQAPPSLPQLKGKGASTTKKGVSAFSTVGRDPLNAGQKRLLEEERERVVKRYREMKEEREQAKVLERAATAKIRK